MLPLAFDKKTEDSAVAAVLKSLLFFGCVVGFEWLSFGPLRARYAESINKALTPLVGQYAGFFLLRTVVECVFLVLLNWILLSFVERKSFLDIGYGSPRRSQFWKGALIGFLPGLILAVPLVVSKLADAHSSPSNFILYMPWALLEAFNLSLRVCGYGLQVLWRRFGGIAGVIATVFALNIRLAIAHPRQWTISDLGLQLASSILLPVVMSLAFSAGKSPWLPLGLVVGLRFSPPGGAVASVLWSIEKQDLWRSTFWRLDVGILHLVILLLVGLLIWRLNMEKVDDGAMKLTDIYVSSWAIGCGLSFLLILEWVLKFVEHPGPDTITENSDLLGSASVLSLYGIVVFCIWLHKSWSAIQDSSTRTTPGKAVGLLFVPLYNLYWAFRALPGFATEFNQFIKRHNLALSPLSSGIFTAYVVLCLISIVPFLGVAAVPATYVVGLLMIRHTCLAVNGLSSWKIEGDGRSDHKDRLAQASEATS